MGPATAPIICVLALTILSAYAAPGVPNENVLIESQHNSFNQNSDSEKVVLANKHREISHSLNTDWVNTDQSNNKLQISPKGKLFTSNASGAGKFSQRHDDSLRNANKKVDSSEETEASHNYQVNDKIYASNNGKFVKTQHSQQFQNDQLNKSQKSSVVVDSKRLPNENVLIESQHNSFNQNSDSEKVVLANKHREISHSLNTDWVNTDQSTNKLQISPKGKLLTSNASGAGKFSQRHDDSLRNANKKVDFSEETEASHNYQVNDKIYASNNGKFVKTQHSQQFQNDQLNKSQKSSVVVDSKRPAVPKFFIKVADGTPQSHWQVNTVRTVLNGRPVYKLILSQKKGKSSRSEQYSSSERHVSHKSFATETISKSHGGHSSIHPHPPIIIGGHPSIHPQPPIIIGGPGPVVIDKKLPVEPSGAAKPSGVQERTLPVEPHPTPSDGGHPLIHSHPPIIIGGPGPVVIDKKLPVEPSGAAKPSDGGHPWIHSQPPIIIGGPGPVVINKNPVEPRHAATPTGVQERTLPVEPHPTPSGVVERTLPVEPHATPSGGIVSWSPPQGSEGGRRDQNSRSEEEEIVDHDSDTEIGGYWEGSNIDSESGDDAKIIEGNTELDETSFSEEEETDHSEIDRHWQDSNNDSESGDDAKIIDGNIDSDAPSASEEEEIDHSEIDRYWQDSNNDSESGDDAKIIDGNIDSDALSVSEEEEIDHSEIDRYWQDSNNDSESGDDAKIIDGNIDSDALSVSEEEENVDSETGSNWQRSKANPGSESGTKRTVTKKESDAKSRTDKKLVIEVKAGASGEAVSTTKWVDTKPEKKGDGKPDSSGKAGPGSKEVNSKSKTENISDAKVIIAEKTSDIEKVIVTAGASGQAVSRTKWVDTKPEKKGDGKPNSSGKAGPGSKEVNSKSKTENISDAKVIFAEKTSDIEKVIVTAGASGQAVSRTKWVDTKPEKKGDGKPNSSGKAGPGSKEVNSKSKTGSTSDTKVIIIDKTSDTDKVVVKAGASDQAVSRTKGVDSNTTTGSRSGAKVTITENKSGAASNPEKQLTKPDNVDDDNEEKTPIDIAPKSRTDPKLVIEVKAGASGEAVSRTIGVDSNTTTGSRSGAKVTITENKSGAASNPEKQLTKPDNVDDDNEEKTPIDIAPKSRTDPKLVIKVNAGASGEAVSRTIGVDSNTTTGSRSGAKVTITENKSGAASNPEKQLTKPDNVDDDNEEKTPIDIAPKSRTDPKLVIKVNAGASGEAVSRSKGVDSNTTTGSRSGAKVTITENKSGAASNPEKQLTKPDNVDDDNEEKTPIDIAPIWLDDDDDDGRIDNIREPWGSQPIGGWKSIPSRRRNIRNCLRRPCRRPHCWCLI